MKCFLGLPPSVFLSGLRRHCVTPSTVRAHGTFTPAETQDLCLYSCLYSCSNTGPFERAKMCTRTLPYWCTKIINCVLP